ncbi:MAG: hydantoinase/oxoprolinase family protein [Dongiaceae bacterium]
MELHIGIDVGGTFTDLAVSVPGEGRLILHKVPSTPDEPDRAIVEGIAEVLARHDLAPGSVVRLSHGTTVGTNALIQRRCGTVAVVTTEGFRDLLEIGRQTRPKVYNIHLDHPPPLVPRQLRFEVAERMRADGSVHRPLDEEGVRRVGRQLRDAGVDCVVVCFLHAYRFPAHERRALALLQEILPERVHLLTSSGVYPEFREYERFSTAVLNGALLTVMNAYLNRFTRNVAALGVRVEPKISQSVGGLMSVERARTLPIAASLSGPAAGALGAARVAEAAGLGNIITLDVGGTSADVSLLKDGRPTEVHERMLAGFPLRLPALDVNAVGAGGGSIAWIDRDGLLKVGPHSAGARPGPACYGFGGAEATVTDANVVLGRLNREALLDGRMPIRRELAEAAIGRLAPRIGLPQIETARGIVRVACSTIVKAIRSVSLERGHNPAEFALFAFGGAGPLLATEIARDLEIGTVVIPADPGILCAEGLLSSDLVADFVRTLLLPLGPDAAAVLEAARAGLAVEAGAWLEAEGIPPADRRLAWSAELRYRGQNYEISLPLPDRPFDDAACRDILDRFHPAHEQAYGFASPDQQVEFVNLKVKARGVLEKPPATRLPEGPPARPVGTRDTIFDSDAAEATPIYRRADLAPGQELAGPAIVEQLDTTVVVFPGDRCRVDPWGNLLITLSQGPRP